MSAALEELAFRLDELLRQVTVRRVTEDRVV